MRTYPARVREVQIDGRGERMAWIDCPPGAVPAPGQYCAGYSLRDPDDILPSALFTGGSASGGFLATPQIPRHWDPGCELALRGPLGSGFQLPADSRRVALIASGDTSARLLPLAEQALGNGAAVALFSDAFLPPLPAAVEAQPLSAAPEASAWADYLAIEITLYRLNALGIILGLASGEHLACHAQALVLAPMPCYGLAECGACAVPMRRGWKAACKDGPVFELEDLGY